MTQSQDPGEDWGGPTPWQQPPQHLQQSSHQEPHPVGSGQPSRAGGHPPGIQWPQQQVWLHTPPEPPPTYLVQAVLVTVLCIFFPFAGVIALVFAAQTSQKIAAGDLPGAQKASRRARLWVIIGLVLGCSIWLLYAIGTALPSSTS
ncbi:hypothetical protein GCM10023328_31500 [Modestobacter marinus]|uniref:Interferon-induced transmembrane protein n=1 Tax=Modestobacter marinus TaxID=477641 RepID=A0A846LR75_9ACTN|nr:CD225/dispanin family protein [Modestobacter marinus]NIH68025.1 hypothetical protein [Modestobacter marinus]GGL69377.1 hypothetical protein GCM10011589_27160 [Modestobacter marinus]